MTCCLLRVDLQQYPIRTNRMSIMLFNICHELMKSGGDTGMPTSQFQLSLGIHWIVSDQHIWKRRFSSPDGMSHTSSRCYFSWIIEPVTASVFVSYAAGHCVHLPRNSRPVLAVRAPVRPPCRNLLVILGSVDRPSSYLCCPPTWLLTSSSSSHWRTSGITYSN